MEFSRRAAIMAGMSTAAAIPLARAAAPANRSSGGKDPVTPEQFGAVGDGNHDDTQAWQAAARTGLTIVPKPGARYLISASISPPPGTPLIIRGGTIKGPGASVLKAAPNFTGYLLKPTSSYEIRGLHIVGNGRDGCHLIGTDEKGSGGSVIIEDIDFRRADTFINFGPGWEHPLGLYYARIYGQHFRTAGIILGGTRGGARSGESAWTFDTVIMTNADKGTAGSLPATGISVTRGGNADLLTWDGTPSPMFGWVVLRSQDGKTGWHVPPNWTEAFCQTGRFEAEKAAGETWQYAVVRQTVGICLRRGKAVAATSVQAEYCGIGVWLDNVLGFNFQAIYSETRDRAAPYPNLSSVVVTGGSYGTIGTTWAEQYGYAIIASPGTQVNTGMFRGRSLKWALYGGREMPPDAPWNRKGALMGSTPVPFRRLSGKD
ncbi:hypothetical protein [Novosphingobium resinovorum]|uniref:hypothetical protein n=1 Tax=Novosphingobium resinovorum TaxID=158500 RepID=UPI002ED431CB|nr:hypothetical protein [Novosphingobium resinovorum]